MVIDRKRNEHTLGEERKRQSERNRDRVKEIDRVQKEKKRTEKK